MITILIWIAGGLLIAVTVLPLWRTDARWVRVWDFPRLQIAVLLIVVLVAAAGFLETQAWNLALMAAMLASLLWQASRILPFLPVYPIQAKASEHCAPDASLTIITSNILIENRDAEPILGMIRARPHLFQKISGLLDPRIGRGLYSTFHAHWRFLRWPVDHVFFEKSFLLSDLVVLPNVGSDHFPLYVALCFQPETGERQESPEASADDREQAHDIVEKAEEKD